MLFKSEAYDHGNKAGFSLVEMGMVLLIVAVVLSGIWVAASAVTENNQVRETVAGVIQIVDKERALFAGPFMPATVYGSSNNIALAVIAAGGVPASWIISSNNAAFRNPFGLLGQARAGSYGSGYAVGLYLIVPTTSAANKIINSLVMRDGNPLRLLAATCYQWTGTISQNTYSGSVTAPTLADCPSPYPNRGIDLALNFEP